MDTTELLIPGESFTLTDLLQKAAAHVGLAFKGLSTTAVSDPFAVHDLEDAAVRAYLENHGFKREPRDDQVFTLVDTNPQETTPGWIPSNYWNFKLDGEEHHRLRIELSVGFAPWHARGFSLLPLAHGTFLSPCDRLPNFRMFKALVERDTSKVPEAALRIVGNDVGKAVVTWTELGLGGIRSLSDLFYKEFARDKTEVRMLYGRLTPCPDPHNQETGEKIYVVEHAQPKVFDAWRAQLKEYRSKLVA